jgi:hypothetical protein
METVLEYVRILNMRPKNSALPDMAGLLEEIAKSGRPLPATRRNGYLIFADRRKSRNLEKRNSDVNAARSGEHKYVDFRQLADSEDELDEEIRYLFI